MEQVLWILGFLPKALWFLLLIVSFLVLLLNRFLNKIPGFYLYSIYIKTVSVIALVVSSWFIGYNYNETKWQTEIKETKQKIVTLEQKNKDLSNTLEIKSQEKIVEIQEKTRNIIKYIEKQVLQDKEVIKYVESCPKLPDAVLEAHNKAAELEKQK
jgi:energy-coupling factor transporter transmembrane protein EcfT